MTSPPLDSTHGRQRRLCHDITALGKHTRSNDVGRGMTSPPFDNTLSKMTSGVACHHRRWAAHTVERRQAWIDITSLGLHAWSDDVGRGMTSLPLDNTHGRQHRAWHDITTFGLNARSDDVDRGMTSLPFDSTHGRQHRAWHEITTIAQHTRPATSAMA